MKSVGVQYEGNAKTYDYTTTVDLQVGTIVAVPVARGWGFSIARVVRVNPEGYVEGLPFKCKAVAAVLGKVG